MKKMDLKCILPYKYVGLEQLAPKYVKMQIDVHYWDVREHYASHNRNILMLPLVSASVLLQ